MQLNVNWSHAPARQLRRVLVDSDGRNMHLLTFVDEVSGRREACTAIDRGPHVPIAGTPAFPTFNEKLQVDLVSSDDLIALHATDVFSKYFISIPVRSKNPRDVRGAFRNSRIGDFGPPQSAQMEKGG